MLKDEVVKIYQKGCCCMSKKPSTDRRAVSGVSSEMLDAAVEIARKQHPYEKELGRINPYTKEPISDEASYLRYLRERCYYDFCDHRIAAERAAANKNADQRISANRRFRVIVFVLLLLALIVTLIVSGRKIDNAYADGRSSGYADGYESGSADGYNDGYADGKADAERNAAANSTTRSISSSPTRSYSGTGTGSTRAAPIADTYIGNKNTHKYHLPTCSYLPDQKNQVLFDSAAEAEASGYTPCGRCHPN
jgi:hypothetical protein